MSTLDFSAYRPGKGPVVDVAIDDDEAARRLQSGAESRGGRAGLRGGWGGFGAAEAPVFRRPLEDPFDPKIGKWGVVVLREDEAEARRALAPLLSLREREGAATSGSEGACPGLVVIDRPAADKPSQWEEALSEAIAEPPHHLMLLGGPDRFPFEIVRAFNARRVVGVLDVADDPVGPLSFEAVARYAEKVCRAARGESKVARESLVYAFRTDKATRRSYDKLATPLLAYLKGDVQKRAPGATAGELLGDDARTTALRERLRDGRPALVVMCTHGVEYPEDPRAWGALTASDNGETGGAPLSVDTFAGDEGPFAAGAVLFAFACFSAGVPENSALIELLEQRQDPPVVPRIAPLPRLLLGRADGPAAFIGHVDRASTSSFGGLSGVRPFRDLADHLLSGGGTVGQAMSTFREMALVAESDLAATVDRRSGSSPQQIVEAWVQHHDWMGWLLLGDPCVKPSFAGASPSG